MSHWFFVFLWSSARVRPCSSVGLTRSRRPTRSSRSAGFVGSGLGPLRALSPRARGLLETAARRRPKDIEEGAQNVYFWGDGSCRIRTLRSSGVPQRRDQQEILGGLELTSPILVLLRGVDVCSIVWFEVSSLCLIFLATLSYLVGHPCSAHQLDYLGVQICSRAN